MTHNVSKDVVNVQQCKCVRALSMQCNMQRVLCYVLFFMTEEQKLCYFCFVQSKTNDQYKVKSSFRLDIPL